MKKTIFTVIVLFMFSISMFFSSGLTTDSTAKLEGATSSEEDYNSKNREFAVLLKKDSGIEYALKLWTQIGDTAVYDVDDFKNGIKFSDLNGGDIIEYTINADKTIDVITKVYDAEDNETARNAKLVKLDKINNDNVEDEDGVKYYNQGDSLYFDYSKYRDNGDKDYDDLDILWWEDFKELDIPNADSDDAVTALIVTDKDTGDEIEFLAFIENYDEIDGSNPDENNPDENYWTESGSYSGYLLDYETDVDDIMTVTIDVFGKGVKIFQVTDDDHQDSIKNRGFEELIVFVLKGGDLKFKDFDYKDYKFYGDADGGKMWFKDSDSKYIEVYLSEDGKTNVERYRYDNDVVVYNDDDQKRINRMDEGDALEFILKDGKVLVIKYTEKSDLDEENALKN